MRRVILLFVCVSFILASCSEERIQEISANEIVNSADFVESNQNLTSNFLPTFTNFYGRDRWTSTNRSSSLASEWVHEYDEEDNLVKSFFYELYPYRILKEVTYLNSGEGNKLQYSIKKYSYYGVFYTVTDFYELIYNDNLIIERIGAEEGEIFEELNEHGWVTEIHTVSPDNELVFKRKYEYDETGNVIKYISYDNPGVVTGTVDYSYNANGDPISYHFQNIAGAETKVEYFYREDNTLERLQEEYNSGDGDFGTKVFTYTQEERLSQQINFKGDGTKEVITYSEDEIRIEHFTEDNLFSEIYLYQIQDENYYLQLHKEYVDGVIHTIKYYDADEELEYTEYYDENGNLSETVYE